MHKVIKSNTDYDAALDRIGQLLDLDPDDGSNEAEDLELLTLLVRDFEDRGVQLWEPDAVDAIEFRMDQQNLSQRDLIPYIGSRSRVSEVLSRKRPLTLTMIRSLHKNLGIPASVLLQDRDPAELDEPDIEWNRFPLREMIKRGWINKPERNARDHAEEFLR